MNSTVTSTSAITINSATRFNNYNQSYTSPKQEKTMNSNTQTQNTIHMTEETLRATIAAAVAEALAQQQQAPAKTTYNQMTKEEAIEASWATKVTKGAKKGADKVIGGVGYVAAVTEVYTFPVVLATTAKVAATSGAVASSIGEKSSKFSDRCAAAAARRTPGATITAETINAKVDYFNSLSEEEKIAFLAKNVVIK